MILFLIIGIIVGAVAVDFAMQNTAPITVALFPWHFTAPLAIIILGSIATGLLIATLLVLPSAIRESLDAFAYRREIRRREAAEAVERASVQTSA